MMKTPICDFVRSYAEGNALRMHMPGHKGTLDPFDITEVDGADSLYEASGIIMESERNASAIFGADTFYSTEGSSLCIRAMLYLCLLYAREQGKKPLIASPRNAHKAFLSAVALLDMDVIWIYSDHVASYLSCGMTADALDAFLCGCDDTPVAVYLTSPDYLGNTLDIKALSEVCRKYGTLLVCDNAHGAYLKFLSPSRHPMDLGADMCCDSAHKTLPALTGAAYLHISRSAPSVFRQQAKTALSLFGSTSPSYLILRSLDALNPYLEAYTASLSTFIEQVDVCKAALAAHGYQLIGDEPLKLTVAPKSYGYTGKGLSDLLQKQNIVAEFADPDFTVMMLTPELGQDALRRLTETLLSLPKRCAICDSVPHMCKVPYVMSPREAMLWPSECVPIEKAIGRVLAAATVACPPAVPIVVSGERITKDAAEVFAYYGIDHCRVVKE